MKIDETNKQLEELKLALKQKEEELKNINLTTCQLNTEVRDIIKEMSILTEQIKELNKNTMENN